jgi:CBS domain-containing membrane protein
MKKITTVRDVMTDIVEVLQVGDTLDLARRGMEAGRIRHLPVVDGEQHLIGLITHRKLLSAWVSDVARDIPIEMVMERDVVTIWPDAPASEAAALLETNKYGCLPVIDNEDKLVGIVTEADFVKFARRFLEKE